MPVDATVAKLSQIVAKVSRCHSVARQSSKTTPRHRFEVDIQNRVCLFTLCILTSGTRKTHPNVSFSAPGCLSALGSREILCTSCFTPWQATPNHELRTRAALVLERFGRKTRESIPWTAPFGAFNGACFNAILAWRFPHKRARFTRSKAQTHQQFSGMHFRTRSRQAHSVFPASSRHVAHR